MANINKVFKISPFVKKDKKTVMVTKKSPFSDKVYEVEVIEEDYIKWNAGALIQNVMPYLSPDIREILISGIGPDEFF